MPILRLPSARRLADRAAIWLVFLCLLPSGFLPAQEKARPTKPADPDRWEEEIAKFEAHDKEEPPAPGGTVFAGSSTIRLWKLKNSFPEAAYLNRGFGGSQYTDLVRYADRMILPYRPKTIVLYSGDNDLQAGKTVDEVHGDAEKLVKRIREANAECKLVIIAVKPSIKRWANIEKIRELNGRLKQLAEQHPPAQLLNFESEMLGEDGMPRPELFVEDGLHLSEQGYALWSEGVTRALVRDEQ